MELGSTYDALRDAGERYILFIRERLQKINTFKVLTSGEELYHLEFMAYHIRFAIRVELLTDCEETCTGHLRFYWQDYNTEELLWVPLNVLPNTTTSDRHEMRFESRNATNMLDASGSPHFKEINKFKANNVAGFGEFIAQLLKQAIPDAKIPIPLHLVVKQPATKKVGG